MRRLDSCGRACAQGKACRIHQRGSRQLRWLVSMCRSSAFVALRSIHFCLPLTAVLGSRKILNCYTCSALSYYAMVVCAIGLALGDFSWQLWFLVWSYSLRAVLQPPCCVCCMRHKLRRQLNIKGTCLEDTWIHCGTFRCAEHQPPWAPARWLSHRLSFCVQWRIRARWRKRRGRCSGARRFCRRSRSRPPAAPRCRKACSRADAPGCVRLGAPAASPTGHATCSLYL